MPWYDSNVFRCKWKRDQDGWRLWIYRHPEICGAGATLEEAEKDLIEDIWEQAPDLDEVEAPMLQFDPPLPRSTSPSHLESKISLKPELYLLRECGLFDCHISSCEDACRYIDSLFKDGVCEHCGAGLGPRSDEPLLVTDSDGADAAMLRFFCSSPQAFHAHRYSGLYWPHIYSEKFVERLSSVECRRLGFRPVEFPAKRRRRKYFEADPQPLMDFAGVKGLDTEGNECPHCGWRSNARVWDFELNEDMLLDLFICDSDIPDPIPTIFAVGKGHHYELCIRGDRLKKLQRGGKLKGLITKRLGIVNGEHGVRNPRLAEHLERHNCPTCSNWPKPRHRLGPPYSVVKLDNDGVCWRDDNWKWIEPALKKKQIKLVRQTRPVSEIIAMAQKRNVERWEYVTFRCPECWRLGKLTLDKEFLRFDWY